MPSLGKSSQITPRVAIPMKPRTPLAMRVRYNETYSKPWAASWRG